MPDMLPGRKNPLPPARPEPEDGQGGESEEGRSSKVRVPKKVMCEFQQADRTFICEVDSEGWGRCGDAILDTERELCPWANEVLEYQDVEPVYLKGRSDRGGIAGPPMASTDNGK